MRILAAVRTIPDSPWSLVARMDTAEVYAPATDRLWHIITIIGALLLGAGGGVGWLWQRQRVRIYEERAKLAETLRALREGSEQLAAIVESSDDAIVGKDMNSLITSWNQGAERMFG